MVPWRSDGRRLPLVPASKADRKLMAVCIPKWAWDLIQFYLWAQVVWNGRKALTAYIQLRRSFITEMEIRRRM